MNKAVDDNLPHPRVQIFVRAIAAGSVSDTTLRATLLLTPAPVDMAKTPSLGFPLMNWPTEVANLLLDSKVSVTLQRADQKDAAKKCQPDHTQESFLATSTALRTAYRNGKGKSDLAEVTKVWQAAFEWDEKTPTMRTVRWNSLRHALKASFDGKSMKAGEIAKSADKPHAAKERSAERVVDRVLTVQQRDLALTLEMMRAREAAASLCEAFGDAGARDTLENMIGTQPLLPTPYEDPRKFDTGTYTPGLTVEEKKKGEEEQKEIIKAKVKEAVANAKKAEREMLEKAFALDAALASKRHYEAVAAEFHNEVCGDPIPLAPATSKSPDDLAAMDPTRLADEMQRPLASHSYGSWLQQSGSDLAPGAATTTTPTTDVNAGDGKQAEEVRRLLEEVSRRFFTIQSTPSLARLFCLVVDVEIPLNGLDLKAGDNFMFVGVKIDAPDAAQQNIVANKLAPVSAQTPKTLTLAKYRMTDEGLPHFWPAERQELYLPAACAGLPDYYSQYNGVAVLGHGWSGAARNPRFDVTSLDIRMGAEGQSQREAGRKLEQERTADPTDDVQPIAKPMDRQSFRTAGLTLVDRGRLSSVAAKLAIREAQFVKAGGDNNTIVLDADELTVGHQLDVGVLVQDKASSSGVLTTRYEWRSLMHRRIDYGASGLSGALVRRVLATLAGPLDNERRTGLDSAQVTAPIRYMPRAGEQDKFDAISEEAIALWDGGPMAVDCSGDGTVEEHADDLPFGRSVDLPSGESGGKLRPPHLRFGWPYRIGMRPVYLGGGCLPHADAARAYVGDLCGKLPYPPSSAAAVGAPAEQRRFLRHERIDPPSLLLPGDLVKMTHGIMGYEKSTEAVIRSVYDHPGQSTSANGKRRATPASTIRYFTPPNVAQAFAALHGVFDKDGEVRPRDGLAGVRYDAYRGGFPSAVASERRGLNGVAFADDRNILAGKGVQGDTVFATSPARAMREVPYYPDPAAADYVLALRHPGTSKYLEGDPIVIPCYKNETIFPGALPLQVKIIKRIGQRSKGAPVQQRDVLLLESKTAFVQEPANSAQKVEVRVAILNLAPGEDYELDVWCVPSSEELARKFAIVEMLGVLAICAGNKSDTADKACVSGLSSLLSARACKLAEALVKANAARDEGFCGPGGLKTPSFVGLRAIATAVREGLQRRPVDEIAAVRSLRVTHAVNRPVLTPQFVDGSPQFSKLDPSQRPKEFRVARPSSVAMQDLGKTTAEQRYAKFFGNNRQAIGSSDFALGGSVLVDLETTSSVEISAETVSPRSPLFDDRSKRRTLGDRRSGVWPVRVQGEANESYFSAKDIYGFYIDENGVVTLPTSKVALIRVDNIPTPQRSGALAHVDEKEIIDLEMLYGLDTVVKGSTAAQAGDYFHYGDGKPVPPRLSGAKFAVVHAFPDGKARKLSLSISAVTRFGHAMRTAARRGEGGYFEPTRPLADQDQVAVSPNLDVWLKATMRPAKPATYSPIPGFHWIVKADHAKRKYVVERHPKVRIRLQRGWYSSGQGERLGIVVWPPNLFDNHYSGLNTNKVLLTKNGEPDRSITLGDFRDEDLGPGGGYVTRWGGDPIRGPYEQHGIFMPKSVFADFNPPQPQQGEAGSATGSPPSDDNAPRLFPNVLMPTGELNEDGTLRAHLTVSLLTYVPRFDASREEWYVDVNLNLNEIPEPFVRLGLVRFQEQADATLQVSQPVVEWTQLMPARIVTVTVTDDDKLKDTLKIEVNVTGRASTESSPLIGGSPENDIREEVPAMRMVLARESNDRSGRLIREEVGTFTTGEPTKDEQGRYSLGPGVVLEKLEAGVTPGEGHTRWYYTFEKVRKPNTGNDANELYYVFVEEIERRRPATYASEPIKLDNLAEVDTVVESGPRFSVRVDLSPS